MGWLATLLRAETAKDLIKRIMKDTLVSGTATLCVSLALSGLTRTVPQAAPPVTEIRRVVEVEQVRPIRDLSAGQARPAAAKMQKAGAGVESETSSMRATASKETPRSRRPVAAPLAPVQAAKPETPVVRLASAEPAASAPLDILAVARRPDAKPESGERGWLIGPAVSLMRKTGQTIATTAVDMKDRMAELTGTVWTVVLR